MLGANGAGKTTTLLALAGELRPLVRRPALGRRRDPASRCTAAPRQAPRSCPRSARRCAASPSPTTCGLRAWRSSARWRCSPSSSHCSAAAPGSSRVASSRCSRSHARSGANLELLLADEVSLGLAPLVVERLLTALRAAADDGVAVVVVEQQARARPRHRRSRRRAPARPRRAGRPRGRAARRVRADRSRLPQRRRRVALHAAATTSSTAIIPLSSWLRMWQWYTYFPRKSVKRIRITTSPPGGRITVSCRLTAS